MGAIRACPRCESRELVRRRPDGISPFAGYTCQGCGTRLRAPGTGLMYGAVLLVCLGLLAFFSMPLWAGIPKGLPDIYCLVAAGGVAVYSITQLLRPAPQVVRDLGAD